MVHSLNIGLNWETKKNTHFWSLDKVQKKPRLNLILTTIHFSGKSSARILVIFVVFSRDFFFSLKTNEISQKICNFHSISSETNITLRFLNSYYKFLFFFYRGMKSNHNCWCNLDVKVKQNETELCPVLYLFAKHIIRVKRCSRWLEEEKKNHTQHIHKLKQTREKKNCKQKLPPSSCNHGQPVTI